MAANQAYGYVLGAGIAKGRVRRIDTAAAKQARRGGDRHNPRYPQARRAGKMNAANLFGGDQIQHYHQAIAVVVAETFEQARAAAYLVAVDYAPEAGLFDLAAQAGPPSRSAAGAGRAAAAARRTVTATSRGPSRRRR